MVEGGAGSGSGGRDSGDVIRDVASDRRWKGGDSDGDGEIRVMGEY